MKTKIMILVLSLFAMILLACAPGQIPQTKPEQREVMAKPEAPAFLPWEQEWQRLVKEAKKEGELNFYNTWSNEERQAVIDAFTKEFGVKVSTVMGRGTELSAKIVAEHRYGVYLADILGTGITTQLSVVKPAGITVPLDPVLLHPDLTEPEKIKEFFYNGKLPWLDKEHLFLPHAAYPSTQLSLNTSIVRTQEIASYRDLLNPKWKGKISWSDPTVQGAGSNSLYFFMEAMGGKDFIEGLVKNEVVIIRDQRTQIDWLTHGKCPIAISAKSSTVEEMIRAGAPLINIIPKEGSYMSFGGGPLALVKNAPHPRAAKLFINWFMTKEVQTLLSRVSGRQSIRVDVPFDHISYPREPGKKYLIQDFEEQLPIKLKYMEIAIELLKPVMR